MARPPDEDEEHGQCSMRPFAALPASPSRAARGTAVLTSNLLWAPREPNPARRPCLRLASFPQQRVMIHSCGSEQRLDHFHCCEIHHNGFMHSTVDGHLGCFPFGKTMKKAGMSILSHVFSWAYVLAPVECKPRNESLSHRANVCSSFPDTIRVSKVLAEVYTAIHQR
ncbi:hypothetical protein EGK_03013 [Macaca mulatta]|uniref:Uncharacterized protein n=2 Tax=Macaca TaxID=9539 RepID=F6XRU5_MACMU|nr:hypothetical protein EGK_03013 [Macaca mulatta]EHH65815.1 hypothetical protein EGM_02658 [Macaca fascicularis]